MNASDELNPPESGERTGLLCTVWQRRAGTRTHRRASLAVAGVWRRNPRFRRPRPFPP